VPALASPVDLLVIYLGTNDAYWLEPIMVARSIGRLVKVARAAEGNASARCSSDRLHLEVAQAR